MRSRHASCYGYVRASLPGVHCCRFPERSMAAYMAHQIVTDMLAFNQPPRLNLCRCAPPNLWGACSLAVGPATP